jgi:hypothetical protein
MIKKRFILVISFLSGIVFCCCKQSIVAKNQGQNKLIQKDSFDFHIKLDIADTNCSNFSSLLTVISCDEVKAIARKEGYWISNLFYPFNISLIDSAGEKIWVIQSFKISFQKQLDSICDNDFKVITIKKLGVNAQTGIIVFKLQEKKTYRMNSFIRITGTKEQLLHLPSTGFLEVRIRSANQLEQNLWEVTAYADELSISTLRADNYNVTILMTAEEIYEEQLKMAEQIEKNKNK